MRSAKGKPTHALFAGYEGEDEDFEDLSQRNRRQISWLGNFKDGETIIHSAIIDKTGETNAGDKGFETKRVWQFPPQRGIKRKEPYHHNLYITLSNQLNTIELWKPIDPPLDSLRGLGAQNDSSASGIHYY